MMASPVSAIPPKQVYKQVSRGDARLLDLRTRAERQRFGWPPGSTRVSLLRHIIWPEGTGTIYLCQLAGRRGAAEVAGGWVAWEEAGLPVEHDRRD